MTPKRVPTAEADRPLGALYPCRFSPSQHPPLFSTGEVLGFTRNSGCLLTLFWFWVRCFSELGLDSIALNQPSLTLCDICHTLRRKMDAGNLLMDFFLHQNSSRQYSALQIEGLLPEPFLTIGTAFLSANHATLSPYFY